MSVSPCRVVSRKPIESKRPSLAVERHVQKIQAERRFDSFAREAVYNLQMMQNTRCRRLIWQTWRPRGHSSSIEGRRSYFSRNAALEHPVI